ncbi:MAG TPA: hypothetical protein VL133_10230 [Devosia sp.]|nr:hypothetical protein [Devosia sp.]
MTAILLGLTGPALAQTVIEGAYPTDAPVDFLTLHSAIAEKLSEPDTAQYKRLILVEGGRGPTICGWMNAVENGNTSRDFPFMYVVAGAQAMTFEDYDPDDLFGIVSEGILEGGGCGPIL